MAAAMLPGARAKPVYYEPTPQWMTGMGVPALDGLVVTIAAAQI